jgi:hypothetical protein
MPSTTNAHTSYLIEAQAQLGGNDFVSRSVSAKAFDLQCLFLRHFGVWVLKASIASTMFHHVLHIALVRVVTQVRGLVVGGVSVFMAHLKTFKAWAKKSLCNDQMDAFFNGLAIFAKTNRPSPLAVSAMAQNTANKFARSVGFVWDNTVKASYGSKVGNFIKTNVAGNRFPDFLHDLPLIVKNSVVMVQRQFAQKQIFGSYPSLANQL